MAINGGVWEELARGEALVPFVLFFFFVVVVVLRRHRRLRRAVYRGGVDAHLVLDYSLPSPNSPLSLVLLLLFDSVSGSEEGDDPSDGGGGGGGR